MTTNATQNSNGSLYLPAILAILFILIAAVGVWATQVRPTFNQGSQASAAEVTTSTESGEAVQASVDLEAVIAAINKGGCTACHTIPNIPNAVGQVGPDLSNIGVVGAERREGYSAAEYIRESLREPNTFIVPECPTGPCIAGTMPQVQLTDEEVDVVVSYLSTLGK